MRIKLIFFLQQEKRKSAPRAHVDAAFFRQLKKLLAIGIPGILSPEAGFVLLVAGSLVARSLCDLWMIRISTIIEG